MENAHISITPQVKPRINSLKLEPTGDEGI